mgnify:FL=1
MDSQSHNFVMTNEVIGSAFQESENMKYIEKPSDMVWKDQDSGKYSKGKECPFISGVLIAGIGDPVPDVKIATKKAPAPKTKAVKPEENK